jgi:hypothetical protein
MQFALAEPEKKKLQVKSNIQSLRRVATHLEELNDEVTFIGGCVTALLITDKAAPDVRIFITNK